jgi:hypothetical protein
MATTIAVRLNAVTGEFETAMKGAARTVSGFEREFAGVASSVAGHQRRMNEAFAAFSGDKVIAEANQLAAAVTKVGGASKLTEQEQRRVNAAVTEAIAKYQALGQTAPASLQSLANATKQVEGPMAGLTKSLGGVFAQFTAANLAANAITAVIGKVSEFAAQGAKLPGLQASFESLTRGVGSSSAEMIASLQTATRGLVSNIDLMQSANKAILLGLPVTTKEMGDLAKTATVLGKAMGQDATKSLDDLITALGRSSPLILDNLGLSVKVGEANEKYAASLGKTVEALTDAEKKTAFYNAAMDAARAKVLELGEQQRTFGEIVSSVWVTVGNEVTQTVADLNVGFGAQIEALLRLIPKTKEAGAAVEEATKKEGEWAQELKVSKLEAIAAVIGLGQYVKSMQFHAEAAKASADAQREFNKLVADAPKPVEVFKLGGAGSRPNQFGTSPLDIKKYYDDLDRELKDAESAAKRAAEAMAAVDKKIVDLIQGSKALTTEQRRLADFFLNLGLSASETALKIGASEVAVSSFKREMEAIDKIMDKGIGSVLGLGESFKTMGEQMKLTDGIVSTLMVSMAKVSDVVGTFQFPGVKLPKFELPDPPPASAWEAQFLGLSDAAAQAAREAGQIWALSFQTIGGNLNQLSRHFDNAFGEIIAGAASVADALSVIFDPRASTVDRIFAGIDLAIDLFKKIGNAFRDEAHEMTNDVRDEFLATFGPGGTGIGSGFSNLAAKLHDELGPAGDALFLRLINAKKVEDFNAAMDETNAALDRAFAARPENRAAAAGFETIAQLREKADAAVSLYEYIRDSGLYSADTVQKAWERANDALIASGDATAIAAGKARQAIDELDSKLKGLYNSIANEAPEEVMGVIESETRAKIAAIEEEKRAAQQAIDAEVAAREEAGKTSTAQYKADADEAYAYTKEVFSEPVTVPVIWSYPNGGPVGQSSLNFTGGGGSTPSIAPVSTIAPEAGTSTTIIELDGQVMAEVTAPYIPGAARRYVGA